MTLAILRLMFVILYIHTVWGAPCVTVKRTEVGSPFGTLEYGLLVYCAGISTVLLLVGLWFSVAWCVYRRHRMVRAYQTFNANTPPPPELVDSASSGPAIGDVSSYRSCACDEIGRFPMPMGPNPGPIDMMPRSCPTMPVYPMH